MAEKDRFNPGDAPTLLPPLVLLFVDMGGEGFFDEAKGDLLLVQQLALLCGLTGSDFIIPWRTASDIAAAVPLLEPLQAEKLCLLLVLLLPLLPLAMMSAAAFLFPLQCFISEEPCCCCCSLVRKCCCPPLPFVVAVGVVVALTLSWGEVVCLLAWIGSTGEDFMSCSSLGRKTNQ